MLREAVDRGVDHIDTAEFYGPDIVNELIAKRCTLIRRSSSSSARSARVAHRGRHLRRRFARRTTPRHRGQPAHARRRHASGRQPAADAGVWPDTFFDDQLAAMIAARDDGLIASIGLSNITLGHLLYASPDRRRVCAERVPPRGPRVAAGARRVHPAKTRSCRSRRSVSVPPVPTRCSTRRSARGRGASGLHAGPGRVGVGPRRVAERARHPRHLLAAPPAGEPRRRRWCASTRSRSATVTHGASLISMRAILLTG